jgi:hypothetical protein
MEMNLESIRKFVNEQVAPVDFLKLLKEAGPDDDAPSDDDPPEDLDGGSDDDAGGDDFSDDAGGDLGGGDLGGPDGDLGGDMGGGAGPAGGPGGDSGEELGDETEATDNRFADREDDPDFTGASGEGSAAEGNPPGGMIYDVEGVLKGVNDAINSTDVNLAEIDNAKNVLEVIANGKKLIPQDFEDIHDYQSFSDIVNRALFQTDDSTKNYFKMKIKKAIIDIQNQKKMDASKDAGEVDSMRDLASKF